MSKIQWHGWEDVHEWAESRRGLMAEAERCRDWLNPWRWPVSPPEAAQPEVERMAFDPDRTYAERAAALFGGTVEVQMSTYLDDDFGDECESSEFFVRIDRQISVDELRRIVRELAPHYS